MNKKLTPILAATLLLLPGVSKAADAEFGGTVPASVVIDRVTPGTVTGQVGTTGNQLSTNINVETSGSATIQISDLLTTNGGIPGSSILRVDLRDPGGQILTSRANDGTGSQVTTGKEAAVAVDAAAYSSLGGAPYTVTFEVTNSSGPVAPGTYNARATIDVTLE